MLMEPNTGQWAILELMGHKVVAGFIAPDDSWGGPMLRVDVPVTSEVGAYTVYYGLAAVYGLTLCQQDEVRRTAEEVQARPNVVYDSGLEAMREALHEAQRRCEILERQVSAVSAAERLAASAHLEP
jgi:hypothetical protein